MRGDGFEELREAIGADRDRAPDEGAPQVHPTAGAVAVGARFPLIAYNVNLESRDLELAKRIATEIRERDGGLPKLKAIGLALSAGPDGGRCRLRPGLDEPHRLPRDRRRSTPSRRCARAPPQAGVAVRDSEVVGLLPLDAAARLVASTLSAPSLAREQVLEARILARSADRRSAVSGEQAVQPDNARRYAEGPGAADASRANCITPDGAKEGATGAAQSPNVGPSRDRRGAPAGFEAEWSADTGVETVVRDYRTSDRSAILGLSERFTEFELPSWRAKREVDEANREAIAAALDATAARSVVLVADRNGAFAGFIHLLAKTDYFTKEDVGYVADIAVHPDHEGVGVAGRLLEAGQAWAKGQGLKTLTLQVFDGNDRAARLYEKHGFTREVVQYTKSLE